MKLYNIWPLPGSPHSGYALRWNLTLVDGEPGYAVDNETKTSRAPGGESKDAEVKTVKNMMAESNAEIRARVV